jgi:Fic family protein
MVINTGNQLNRLFPDAEYLSKFELSRGHIRFPDEVFFALDESIRSHIVFESKDLERYLIAQTEFLSTFSTAKAEEINQLSPEEALRILNNFLGFDEDNTPPVKKVSNYYKLRLDAKEYKDIVHGFRYVSYEGLRTGELSVEKIKELHAILTEDLDKLSGPVSGEKTDYYSGTLRSGIVWIGGKYRPAPGEHIEKDLSLAIDYYKQHQSIADCFIFSMAMYAIHPFNNGNKRVCRILEHALLRDLGINKANIYSHIVETYHSLDRYKKAIEDTLRKNVLNGFVNMQMESLFWTQMHTLRAAVEFDRRQFVDETLAKHQRKNLSQLLKGLINTKSLQFKDIRKLLGNINDKLITSLLGWCLENKILYRQASGKESFYTLAIDSPIEKELLNYYDNNKVRVTYTPEEFATSILQHAEYFRKTPGDHNLRR